MTNVNKFPNTENENKHYDLDDLFELANCSKIFDKLGQRVNEPIMDQDTASGNNK